MPNNPTTDPSDATEALPGTDSKIQNLSSRVEKLEQVVFGDEKIDHTGLQKKVTELKDGQLKKILNRLTSVTVAIIVAVIGFIGWIIMYFK